MSKLINKGEVFGINDGWVSGRSHVFISFFYVLNFMERSFFLALMSLAKNIGLWRKGSNCQWKAQWFWKLFYHLFPHFSDVEHDRFMEFHDFSMNCGQPMGTVLISKHATPVDFAKKGLSVDPNSTNRHEKCKWSVWCTPYLTLPYQISIIMRYIT